MRRFFERAEQHALTHVEHVHGPEHYACGGKYSIRDAEGADLRAGEGGARRERTQKYQEFTDKTVQSGKADAAQREDNQEESKPGHGPGESTDLVELPRVITFVDHANDEEQRAG